MTQSIVVKRWMDMREFIHGSYRKLLTSPMRRTVFLLITLVCSILFVFVIGDMLSRYFRIAFAGALFTVCLIGSILYGLPAATLCVIANGLGAFFTASRFGETHDWYFLAIAAFQITTAVASFAIAVISDIERNEKARYIAASLTDSLTGIYNARYFRIRLAEEIERSARRGTDTSILFVDLDAFKSVNDDFGHASGDSVLKATANFIVDSVRKSDVACRQGGDEFVVILPETSLEVAENIGARMQSRYAAYLEADQSVPAGASCGLSYGAASYPSTGDLEALLKHADEQLYRDKRRRGTGRSI